MTTPTGKGDHGGRNQKLHPPFAQPDPGRRATPHMAAEISDEPSAAPADSFELTPSESDELYSDSSNSMPSIDEFVDDLPLIDEFLLESSAHVTTPVQTQGANTGDTTTDEGWADADWQSYDWSRLASLGAPAPEAAAAHAEWSSTNWDAGRGRRTESEHLREDEVADALDEIARRIRSGELSLRQFRGSPPEAAIAAAFASVLRSRG